MEKLIFETHLQRFKEVAEDTTYLEMFFYSDPKYDTTEEHPLPLDEFENFLYQKLRGCFQPYIPEGATLQSGLRFILQKNARHPETFAPNVLSMKRERYSDMVHALRLPMRGVESSSCVGPFFWAGLGSDKENPCLQIVQRKSDVRKKGYTRGWELMLSHDFRTNTTSAFCKGTPSSDIMDSIKLLKACGRDAEHPLLFPMIIFSHDASSNQDVKQRGARDWLSRLEHVISMRNEIVETEGYEKNGLVDLDAVNRDLVECHAQVLWKRPIAYLRLIDSFKEALDLVFNNLSSERKNSDTQRIHDEMRSRLEFYKRKWEGIDTYASTTLERIETQKSSLYNLLAQKESKLNLQMAIEQRKLAHLSKRDSSTMKTISLLGSVFLPGAYLASIFSTTFFDFHDSPTLSSAVSPKFWLYWAVTIPVTLFVIGVWLWWDRKRGREFDRENDDLENGSEDMERMIMTKMRQRTRTVASTWNARVERKQMLARDEDNDFGAFKYPKPPQTGFGDLLTVPAVHNY